MLRENGEKHINSHLIQVLTEKFSPFFFVTKEKQEILYNWEERE